MSSQKTKNQSEKNNTIRVERSRSGGKKKVDLFARLKNNDEHPLDSLVSSREASPVEPDQSSFSTSQSAELSSFEPSENAQNFGRPNVKNDENLVDLSTKNTVWSTKENSNLVDKSTKEKNLVDQKSKIWAKYEKARSTDRIGLRPNRETLTKFKVYCAEAGLTLTEFFEISGLKYLDLVDQSDESLVDLSTIDDRRLMIRWKTKSTIINLHLRYNSIFNSKTKWKINDDEKAFHLNNVDLKIIELGIIQTQFQKGFKGKINSFSYYLNEIENFIGLEMSDEVLDTMLKINRQRWQQLTGKILNYEEFEQNDLETKN